MRYSIPTLRSVTIGARSYRRCRMVSVILGGLVPLSARHNRVAPNLTRVELHGGASAVTKAGKGIAAGLWPALEELDVSNCRANADHFDNLAHGLSTGCAQNLRVLNWDSQSNERKTPVDAVILSALSTGRCPRIERLSFTGNRFCPEYRIHGLRGALRASPNLQQLSMDCSRSPRFELRELTLALKAGYAPRLDSLYVRSTKKCLAIDGTREALKGLLEAATSRVPPVHVESKINGGSTKLSGNGQ